MFKLFSLLLFLSMGLSSVQAQTPSPWMEVHSPNFVVLTDTNERQARKIAAQFERMRSVFRTILPNATGDAGLPIIVLALKDKKGFQALEPAEYLAKGQLDLAGYFLRTQDKGYILLRLDAEGEHPFATVYHEYTHLIMSKAIWLPLWMNEGLAEFFQNTDIHDKDVLLGQPSPYDIYYLRDHRLIPLTTLLAVDHASPYYHDEQKGSVFYAESWALMHYIQITDAEKHTQRLQDYARALSKGEDAVTAAQHTLGDLSQLQKALDAYVGQMAFRAFKINAAFPFDEASFQVRPIPRVEVDAVRADVLVSNRRTKDGQALLEAVLRDDPKSAAAHESMGSLKFREGDVAGAKKWYGEAVQLDSHSYLAHYYYATMSLNEGDRDHDETVESSLRAAIKLKPDFAPAYDTLAMFYASRQKTLNEAHLLNIKAVQLEPENLQYRINTAIVLEQENQFPGAAGVLQAAVKVAKTPDEAAMLQNLLDHAKQYQAAAESGRAVVVRSGGGEPAQEGTVTTTETKQMEGIVVKDPGAGKVVIFKKVDGQLIGKAEEAKNYPVGDSRGAKHTVQGILRGVECSYPAVLALSVERQGEPVKLYHNDFYKIAFTQDGPDDDDEIKPCTGIEGLKARVVYAEVDHAQVAGQIVSIELMK